MAIIERGGRRFSILEDKSPLEYVESLKKYLAPDELEVIESLLDKVTSGNSEVIDALENWLYEERPVSIEQFLFDPYYLGNVAQNTYPVLVEDLKEIFSRNYYEVVLSGSIGWGKTYLASLIMCRVIYEVSCLRSPQLVYGLSPDSKIYFVNISVTQRQSREVINENITSKLLRSPYFTERLGIKATRDEVFMKKGLRIYGSASSDTNVLGLNVFGAVMDESNFMQVRRRRTGEGFVSNAELIHDAIIRRMKSRYMTAGKVPGIFVIISSRQSQDDFTEKRIAAAVTDPGIFVREYALWDVKPGYEDSPRFKVFVGNSVYAPAIINKDNEAHYAKLAEREDIPIIDVPEEYKEDFETDLMGALRDIAGIGVWSIKRYIRQPQKVLVAVDNDIPIIWSSGVRWQFGTGGKLITPTSWGDIDKEAIHVVHIDTSLTENSTGIAMGYISGVHKRKMGEEEEIAPIICIDFLLEVVPPLEGEIDFGVIRNIIYELRDRLGFNIQLVTMDRFQTAEMAQRLRERDFEVKFVSLDRDIEPYELLKAALYDERVKYPHSETLIRELTQLIYDPQRNKVDHPPDGSKDLADCVAAVVYNLEKEVGVAGDVALEVMEQLRQYKGYDKGSGGGFGNMRRF